MNVTLENIDDYFTYHPPTTQERIDAHKAVNEAAKAWATSLILFTENPSNTDSMHTLIQGIEGFKQCQEKYVADPDIDSAITDSMALTAEIMPYAHTNPKEFLTKAILEVQFCRMMANQAITIADINRQRAEA